MQILNYFNVVTRSFTTVIEPYRTRKKVGDMYKVNNVLLSILELEVKTTPLKYTKKKVNDYRGKVGDFIIGLGKSVKKQPKKTVEVVYKTKYPWWNDNSL